MNKPTSSEIKTYSDKIHAPSLRCKIDLSVSSGGLMWFNGLFPDGTYPDLLIFKKKIVLHFTNNEQLIDDNGHFHTLFTLPIYVFKYRKELHSVFWAFHIVVIEIFKKFNYFRAIFTHIKDTHLTFLHTTTPSTALMIFLGDRDPLLAYSNIPQY